MYAIVLHAHQKLDRVALRHLHTLVEKDVFFPTLPEIVYYEGQRGPDSTNLKNNPNVSQPWHFINPFDDTDTALLHLIQDNVTSLTQALKDGDRQRSSYEAAWLAHALVDGLTPAHHHPYEQEMELIRGGATRHDRAGLLKWMYVKGENRRDSIRRSLQLVGPKGLLTTHGLFEGGAYTILRPLRLNDARPSREELRLARELGVPELFRRYAREVASYDLYNRFYKDGWTSRLTRDVRREMAPRMAKLIAAAWFYCLCEAGLVAEP